MDVLSGSYVKIQTMDNDTVRIIIDLDCTLEQAAALSLRKGTPLAVARLTPEAGIAAMQPRTEPEPAPVKGGALAKLAGMWCADPEFHAWIRHAYDPDVQSSEKAAVFVRFLCGIKSRAELDSNERAAMRFQEFIRLPFMAYCQGRTK